MAVYRNRSESSSCVRWEADAGWGQHLKQLGIYPLAEMVEETLSSASQLAEAVQTQTERTHRLRHVGSFEACKREPLEIVIQQCFVYELIDAGIKRLLCEQCGGLFIGRFTP